MVISQPPPLVPAHRTPVFGEMAAEALDAAESSHTLATQLASSFAASSKCETPMKTGSRHVTFELAPSAGTAVDSCSRASAAAVPSLLADLRKEVPSVAPVLVALQAVQEQVDSAKSNKKELIALRDRCTYLTACVIVKFRSGADKIDVAPLVECVNDLDGLVRRCGTRGRLAMAMRGDVDRRDVAELHSRISELTTHMGLAGIVAVEERVDDLKELLSTMKEKREAPADLNPNKTQNNGNGNSNSNDPKSAPCTRRRISGVPKGTPPRQSWHVTRERVVKRVIGVIFEGFRGHHGEAGGRRRVVGLVGDSGSGKTTAAAELVRGGVVRELFSDGVVWLNVGRGAKDRLRCLMHDLATMVHQVVCCGKGRPPPAAADSSADGYSSAAYIREMMTGTATQGGGGGSDEGRRHHRRCLLVADSVWEPEVIALLRETGTWVLVTTRLENLVRDAEGETVRLDKLSPREGEAVLRGAAGIPADVPLPDAARDLGELCGYMAMDLAYVGRWNSVCGRRDRLAWSDAEASIRIELDAHDYEMTCTPAGGSNRTKLRAAVLRAGFDELGMEGPVVQWLYMALAVMPDAHAFSVMDAAVLLWDGECDMADVEFCRRVVDVLERLSIVRAEGSVSAVSDMTCGWWQTHKYRMHAAHCTFARENLMDRADVLGPAVERWVRHISSEQAVREISPVVLVELWRAVKYVAGCGGSDEYFVSDTGLSRNNTAGAATAAAGARGSPVSAIDGLGMEEHMEVHGLGKITNTRICSLAVQSALRAMQFHAERQDWDCALTMWSRALDWVHTAETDKSDDTAALANGGSPPPLSPSASSSAEVVFEELVQLGWRAWEAGCEEKAVDMVKKGVAMGEARLGPANFDDALMARGGLRLLARFCELTTEGKVDKQPAVPLLLQQQRQLREEEEKAASSLWRRAGSNGSADSPRSDPQTVQITLHQLAVGVWDTRRYEEAMSLLRRALENAPQSKAGGVASIGMSGKDVAVNASTVHDANRWVQGTEGTE